MKAFSQAFVSIILALSDLGATAHAQSQGPAPSQLDGFLPINQLPPGEQLPAAPFLIAAYVLIWMLVFGYVWITWRRLSKMEGEFARLANRKRTT
jgi:CcmD family protein